MMTFPEHTKEVIREIDCACRFRNRARCCTEPLAFDATPDPEIVNFSFAYEPPENDEYDR